MAIYGLILIVLLAGLTYQYLLKGQGVKVDNLRSQEKRLEQQVKNKEQRLTRIEKLDRQYERIKEKQKNQTSLYILENQRLDVTTIYNNLKKFSNQHKINIEKFTPELNASRGKLKLTINGDFMDVTNFINKLELLSGDIVVRQLDLVGTNQDLTTFKLEIEVKRLKN